MVTCVFSGQGAQYSGMGQNLYGGSAAARKIYDEAADLLGFDLMKLDEEQLAEARFTQLSVVVLSLAAWQAFNELVPLPSPAAFAGFSAGEYSALCASGVLGFTDLLSLVNTRARLMQEASEENPGAMFAIIGLDDIRLYDIVSLPAYAGIVYAANYNSPGQVVISGQAAEAEACANDMKAAGARRVVRLKVGGAFHTPLMAKASRQLEAFAKNLTFGSPSGAFYLNATGGPAPTDQDWPAYLARHMCSPVFWTREVQALQQDGAAAWLEFGPGKVLCGLIRKILPGTLPLPVEDMSTLKEALQIIHQL